MHVRVGADQKKARIPYRLKCEDIRINYLQLSTCKCIYFLYVYSNFYGILLSCQSRQNCRAAVSDSRRQRRSQGNRDILNYRCTLSSFVIDLSRTVTVTASVAVWQWQWLCQALCRVALWGSLNNMLIDSLSQLSTRHPSKQTEKWLPYAHTHTNTHAHTHVWLHMSVLAKEWPRMELRIGIGIGIR